MDHPLERVTVAIWVALFVITIALAIPGYVIGKIRIEDKVSFVDIPEDVLEQVLKQNGNYRLGKKSSL